MGMVVVKISFEAFPFISELNTLKDVVRVIACAAYDAYS